MFKLAEPTGKYGRWGQAGDALVVFWFLGVLSNFFYRLVHPPLWMMFAYMALSLVFSIWGAFFVTEDEEDENDDAQSSPVSEP